MQLRCNFHAGSVGTSLAATGSIYDAIGKQGCESHEGDTEGVMDSKDEKA